MTQKFLKLLLLVSCVLPVQVSARVDQSKKAAPTKASASKKMHRSSPELAADADADEDATRAKMLTSLEVAGPGYIRDQLFVGSLTVENGESIGGDLSVNGRVFANGFILQNSPLFVPQYAFLYDSGGQSVGNNDDLTFNNGGLGVPYATPGISYSAGNITMSVPGIYSASYCVVVETTDGTAATTYAFELGLTTGTLPVVPVRGSEGTVTVTESLDTDEIQVTGQAIFTVTTAGQVLNLINVSGATVTIPPTAADVTLRIQRIG